MELRSLPLLAQLPTTTSDAKRIPVTDRASGLGPSSIPRCAARVRTIILVTLEPKRD